MNQVDVMSTNDKESTKFETQTCHNTEIASTITRYSWFYPLYIHASDDKAKFLTSKSEILLLLYTGVSVSLLNLFHSK